MEDPKWSLWTEKYRPQNLSQIILEDSVRSELGKFIDQKSIPHLLLVGNVGSGKTTVAKILLKSLDCDSLEMNASSERGIQVIRDKVVNFAMMYSLKRWKIAFMDEFDAVTPDAQMALRNVMETYSDHVRFILTANYSNKILEPIKSRCQIVEFERLDKKHTIKLLQGILEKEKVKYDADDFLTLVEDHYPDIRSMINTLQLDTVKGEFQYRRSFSLNEMNVLVDRIKKGDLSEIRKMPLDYTEAYKFLFNRVEEFTEDYDKKIQISLAIADSLRDDTFSADKEITFAACILRILEQLKIRVK